MWKAGSVVTEVMNVEKVRLFGERVSEVLRFLRKDKTQDNTPTLAEQKMPKPDLPKKERPISRLTVRFRDNFIITWTCSTVNGVKVFMPWRDFYKWYFGRPQSQNFVVRFTKGQTMIRRNDIRSFTIEDL